MRVTVLEKVYGPIQPEALQPYFAGICSGLEVKVMVVGVNPRGWIQLEVDGEDEEVAVRLLEREVGLAPITLQQAWTHPTLKGKVSSVERGGLLVDVGIIHPTPTDAYIPLQRLRAQAADGAPTPIHEIVDTYCLHANVPVEVRLIERRGEDGRIEAEFSDTQIGIFHDWAASHLDRLVILGATHHSIKRALKASKHWRDVIRVERLGLLEHAVLCKLGTDAEGLIPELGPHLPHATLLPFKPDKAYKLLGA